MTKSRGIRNAKGTRPAFIAANQGLHFCQCGCKGVITIRADHFHHGIPRYKLGHNPQPKNAPLASMPCACGCGASASPGKKYVSGHNGRGKSRPPHVVEAIRASKVGAGNPMFGKRAVNFKGRISHSDGYIMIWQPDHPFASNGHVLEHRLVMEAHLRETDPTGPYLVEVQGERYLSPMFNVHHENQDKADNRIENLRVLTTAEHSALHMRLRYPQF